MNKEKTVCFVGHRDDWRISDIKDRLKTTIEQLIVDGYTVFFDGDMGAFDNLCRETILKLKKQYPFIKIILVTAYYHEKREIPACYSETVFVNTELYHYKQKIIKRNEWIVDNSDIIVSYVTEKYKSGAYRTLKYAQKQNKPIICLNANND